MKIVNESAAQGDLLVTRVEALPSGLEESRPEPDGSLVVGHSETGHHHVVQPTTDAAVRWMRTPAADRAPSFGAELVSFLEVRRSHADLVHLRPWDTHEALRLLPGIYEIRRQREWVPTGWRRVED